MLGLDAPSHWAILLIAAVVLFGYKKLPEVSRSVGRSLRIFKTEMKGLTDDDAARDAADAPKSEPPASATPVVPVVPVSPQVPPPVVPPSLGADTNAAVPTAEADEPAAEAAKAAQPTAEPWETPQQQTWS
ncbi:MAG: twin-arginine translocase TatA/TatE family subunit [Jatrophihabitantaceae bacterium]